MSNHRTLEDTRAIQVPPALGRLRTHNARGRLRCRPIPIVTALFSAAAPGRVPFLSPRQPFRVGSGQATVELHDGGPFLEGFAGGIVGRTLR